jgi:hypothetical protein
LIYGFVPGRILAEVAGRQRSNQVSISEFAAGQRLVTTFAASFIDTREDSAVRFEKQ